MAAFIHGHTSNGRSNTYNSWRAMKRRCNHPKCSHHKRGITYDPRWESFEAFYADMGDRPTGQVLSRRDHDGPYCLLNCEWADCLVNCRSNRGSKAPRRVDTHPAEQRSAA